MKIDNLLDAVSESFDLVEVGIVAGLKKWKVC